jgi:hypothetical protein
VRKVHSTGYFLEKKSSRQNTVLNEAMVDKNGPGLEHSLKKSLA